MKALYVEAEGTGYSPRQVEDATMTVEELISCLEEMGEAYGFDARVFISNDNGYTYGPIGWESVSEGGYDGDRAWLGEDLED